MLFILIYGHINPYRTTLRKEINANNRLKPVTTQTNIISLSMIMPHSYSNGQ